MVHACLVLRKDRVLLDPASNCGQPATTILDCSFLVAVL